jgi:HPt (histidine-containing phosphotransfer) domain-containing protein
MNDHVAKPIEVEKLFEVLQRWAPAGGCAGPADPADGVREAAKAAVEAARKAVPSPTPAGAADRVSEGTTQSAAKAATAPAPGKAGEARPMTQHPRTHHDAPAPGKAGEAMPRVPHIPGVDAAGAVSRLAGNTRIYLKTVRLFLDNIPRYRDEVVAAVEEKDKERLKRGAHTLKGLAATIGATGVSAAAAAVEKAQADGNAAPDPSGVDALLEMLAALERNPAASGVRDAPAQAAPPADIEPVLDKLKALLREYDGSAADCFAENKAVLDGRYPADICRELERMLRDFEYDEALELLETKRA